MACRYGAAMADESGLTPGDDDEGLSGYAKAMRAAAPWLDATSRLTGGAVLGVLLGYAIDRWRDTGPWGLIIGSTLGISLGLYGFLATALKMSKTKK